MEELKKMMEESNYTNKRLLKETFKLQAQLMRGSNLDTIDELRAHSKNEIRKRFQRTIRRLYTLRRFAKKLGLEFDIEQLELSQFFTKDKHHSRNIYTTQQLNKIPKLNYIETIANSLECECFFQEEHRDLILSYSSKLRELMNKGTENVKDLEQSIYNIDLP